MGDWQEGYKQAVAEFLVKNGTFVRRDAYYEWLDYEQQNETNDYDDWHTLYGWEDYHSKNVCLGVVNVDLSSIRERTLSIFDGTFTDNKMEVGVEVLATCDCGKFENKWLRWTGSLGDILPQLLKLTDD